MKSVPYNNRSTDTERELYIDRYCTSDFHNSYSTFTLKKTARKMGITFPVYMQA